MFQLNSGSSTKSEKRTVPSELETDAVVSAGAGVPGAGASGAGVSGAGVSGAGVSGGGVSGAGVSGAGNVGAGVGAAVGASVEGQYEVAGIGKRSSQEHHRPKRALLYP